MSQKTRLKLPTRLDQETAWTADIERYGRAWRSLGEAVQSFFPSYEVVGYDPFVRLQRSDLSAVGHRAGTSFDLSVDAAIELTHWKEIEVPT
jgi:hypothetical protein